MLLKGGAHVFSPICHSHHLAIRHALPGDYEFWRELDRDFIRRSDRVYVLMLEGWEHSKGVADEVAYAESLGKKVYYFREEDLCLG